MIEILIKLISIPFIIFIPGFLFYNLLIKNKLSVDLFETIFINILASLLISGWGGLFLAELGYFSLENLIIGLLIFSFICAILILIFKRNLSFKNLIKPKINYKSIILFIILLVAIKLFFLPGENITINQDDVVIVNHGVNIAHTGSIFGSDSILNKVKHKNLFYDFQQKKYQYPGFGFYFNPKTERITFHYLDFYPVLLAVFYLLFGVEYFLYLTPLLAILAVMAVFITVKQMFSWEAGMLSCLFLSFSFPQIWFSRYPCAEIITQLLIFSGLFIIILLLKYKKPFFAFFSAFIFSTLMLVRLDSLFTAWSFVIFITLLQLIGKFKNKIIYIISFSYFILYGWALLHNYIFDKLYVFIPSKFLLFTKQILGSEFPHLHLISFLLFYGFPVILLIVTIITFQQSRIIPKLRPYIPSFDWKKIRGITPFLIALPFIILYIYRYPFSDGLIGQKQTLLIIQSFLTPIGLFISILGLIIIIHQYLLNAHLLKNEKSLSILCFILIVVPYIVYYIFLSLHNQPVFPWGFRRYIPIIFPFFIICLSYFLVKIYKYQFKNGSILSKRLKSIAPKIFSLGLIAIIFHSMLFQNLDSGILTHREFEGLIEETKSFSSYFDKNSIILFYPISFSTGISVPLKYIFHRNTILLPKLKTNDDFFNQISLWKSKNRPVYIVTPQPSDIKNHFSGNCKLVPRLRFQVDFPKMHSVGKPIVGGNLYGDIWKYKNVLHIFEIQRPLFHDGRTREKGVTSKNKFMKDNFMWFK